MTAGSHSSLGGSSIGIILSFAKTPSGEQVVDLSALIRRQSEPDDHPPAPSAPTPPVPVRRPPPARPREPRLAAATGRLQADGEPAEASTERSAPLGLAVRSLARLEAGPRHRGSRHCAALAATPLSPPLGHPSRAPPGGPPARRRRDQSPGQKDGHGQSPVGCPQNPWRTPQARHRRR